MFGSSGLVVLLLSALSGVASSDDTSVTVCEGKSGLIQCAPDEGLLLHEAFMGRRDSDTCPHSSILSTNCSSDTALDRLRTTCEGRMFCHLPVYDNFGEDPCPGTYKYLEAEYTCQVCDNMYDNDNCTSLAANGECNTNRDWMMDNCFKACTRCDQSECESSEDLEMCDYWGIRRECNTGGDWMTDNCPMACRSCGAPDVMPVTTTTTTQTPTTLSPLSQKCVNLEGDEECSKFYKWGECRKNPTWMWGNCHRACSRCDCYNKHSNDTECSQWQQWGECGKNPDFMWDQCHKACSMCEGVRVTHKVSMNVTIGDQAAGVIVFGVFGDIVPKTVANFVALANHTYGFGYKNTLFHRVIQGFVVQGGDITQGNGYGGRSIYGGQFDDENFILKHYGKGWVNMANAGEDTNESQFAVLTEAAGWLDNRHVVFAKIVEGYEALRKVETTPTGDGDRPVEECKVVNAWVEKLDQPYEVQKVDVVEDGEYCSNEHSDSAECSRRGQAGDCFSDDYSVMYFMWDQCYQVCSQCATTFTAPTTSTVAPTSTTPPRECKNGQDGDAVCEGWAATGQCEDNEEYMMEECYKACSDCNFNGTRAVLVCEGEELALRCPANRYIHIYDALWGRADDTTCRHSEMNSTECADDMFLSTMQGYCDGYNDCRGDAAATILGDPCPGTYKYAYLAYKCQEN